MRESDAGAAGNGGTLDAVTAAVIGFASATALGDERRLAARSRHALVVAVPPVWMDELLLQSVLMVGYPRALVAAAVWRQVSGIRAPATDQSFAESGELWRQRGEETCGVVYGANYQRLRENVRALHPALDAWMITEGYGRVLSRPGLDLMRRELCTIAQIAVLGSPHQLHSHMRGALHAGATPGMVAAVLAIADPDLAEGAREVAGQTLARVTGTVKRPGSSD
jgi:4-carboxymuconolactone decarboxylase